MADETGLRADKTWEMAEKTGEMTDENGEMGDKPRERRTRLSNISDEIGKMGRDKIGENADETGEKAEETGDDSFRWLLTRIEDRREHFLGEFLKRTVEFVLTDDAVQIARAFLVTRDEVKERKQKITKFFQY